MKKNILYFLSKESKNVSANNFFGELFNLIGVNAEKTESVSELNGCKVLFTGEGDYFSAYKEIEDFVSGGGTLISLGSLGLDGIFGIKETGVVKQESEFSVNGHFVAKKSEYASGVLVDNPLPIISNVRNCSIKGDTEALGIWKERNIPLLFRRKIGDGNAINFSFSLLKTIWYKTQGRPVYEDLDGDGCLRAGDSIITDYTDEFLLPTVDIYLHLIENMIFAAEDTAIIHQIPPKDDKPADYVLHFCGDEDWCGSKMYTATKDMAERGIKYHVHLQPKEAEGRFTIDKKQFDELKSMGMETSLHFDMITNGKFRYGKEDLSKQVELYKNTFGELPITANTHWFIYTGFGETSRWYGELGLKGTIKKLGIYTDLHDINAMNLYGFSFGTSYPTYTLDDKEHGYKNYGVENLKITFYEPRLKTPKDEKRIEDNIALSDDFALISNIFIHPVYYTSDREAVLGAVDKILALTKGKNVKIMSTDEVTSWWSERRKLKIERISESKYKIDFNVPAVIKFREEKICEIDGKTITSLKKNIAGKDVFLLALPKGKYTVEIK